MKNTREIRWLQLPDLNKIAVSGKLSDFGKTLCKQFAKTIDFVIITGDLYCNSLQRGKVLDFLNRLSDIIDKKNIIIIVGDSDEVYLEKDVKETVVQVRKRINNNLEWKLTESEESKLTTRFVNHINFLNEFYNGSLDFESLYKKTYVYENNIALMCVNTAYIGDGDHTKKQIIDRKKINQFQNKEYPCIAIMHHDYYEINEVDRDYLKDKLSELNISAILCGHKFEETPDFVKLEDGTRIPICCCMKSESKSNYESQPFGIFEYRWKINTESVLLNEYKWNFVELTFKIVAHCKFKLRSIHSVHPLNEKRGRKWKNIPDTTRQMNRRKVGWLWGYRKELIVIMTSLVITLLLICAFRSRNARLHISFKEIVQDNILVFTNSKKISEAWIQIVGQIVIITKEEEIIKTYLVEEMYEKSTYISDTKEFEIKELECPLADSCVIKFEQELETLLMQKGYDKDAITVKKIGFTAISLPTSEKDNWTPYYYILDGNSFIPLSLEQAEAKMGGTMITEEIWYNAREQKRVLAEFTTCVSRKLEKMSN